MVGVLKCREYQIVSGGSYFHRALSGYQSMTKFGQLHKQMCFLGTRCSVSKLSIKNAACFRSWCSPRPLWNEMLGCRSKTASQRKDSEWINYWSVYTSWSQSKEDINGDCIWSQKVSHEFGISMTGIPTLCCHRESNNDGEECRFPTAQHQGIWQPAAWW